MMQEIFTLTQPGPEHVKHTIDAYFESLIELEPSMKEYIEIIRQALDDAIFV